MAEGLLDSRYYLKNFMCYRRDGAGEKKFRAADLVCLYLMMNHCKQKIE